MAYDPNNKHAALLQSKIDELKEMNANGLDPVLDGVEDMLFDFFPDFHWAVDVRLEQYKLFIEHPEFKDVAAQFKARFGFDFAAEMQKVIDDL